MATVLLSHFDGIDGATEYVDSLAGVAIFYGNAQLDTSQKVFGTASLKLDGNSDYITYSASANYNFGADPFTIDFRVRFSINQTCYFTSCSTDKNNRFCEILYDSTSSKLQIYNKVASVEKVNCSCDFTPVLNTWYHIAVVRSGASVWIFVNGVSQTVTATVPIVGNSFGDSANTLYIGRTSYSATYYFAGWIDEVRISKGIARWTADFTPPTEAYDESEPAIVDDLVINLPNHGYANDTPIYVSWLDGIYYVSERTQNTFKIAEEVDGDVLLFSESIYSGYVREIAPATGTTTVTGLDHLEGKLVYLIANGSIVGEYTVSGGSISVSDNLYAYQAGLPYSFKVKTMRMEVSNPPMTTQKKIKRIMEVGIRYIKSIGGKIGQEIGGIEYLQDANCEFNTKSKDVSRLNKGGYDPDSYVVVKSDKPYPFTLISIMTILDVTE